MKALAFFLVVTTLVLAILMPRPSQEKMEQEARIPRSLAEAMALSRIDGGEISSSQLDHENGQLLWSVEVLEADTGRSAEVSVDATTGMLLAMEFEKPAK